MVDFVKCTDIYVEVMQLLFLKCLQRRLFATVLQLNGECVRGVWFIKNISYILKICCCCYCLGA